MKLICFYGFKVTKSLETKSVFLMELIVLQTIIQQCTPLDSKTILTIQNGVDSLFIVSNTVMRL